MVTVFLKSYNKAEAVARKCSIKHLCRSLFFNKFAGLSL